MFTQTEQGSTAVNYRTNCAQNENQQQTHKEMFDPNMQQNQQQQAQMYVVDKKNSDAKVSSVSEFPFCYNVNMLQKQAANNSSSTSLGAISQDDKGCYRFDVGQPFTYNYALVNQMSLAAAANTAQFKCEVCGLVFGHLSLLNHHKRIHNAAAVTTTNTATTTNNTNAIQTQVETHTQQAQSQTQAQTQTQTQTQRTYSCDQCGTCVNNSSELKSHKLSAHPKPKNCNSCGMELDCKHYKGKLKYIKCENCLEVPPSNYSGNDSGSENSCTTTKPGHHPVKRRGMATVTKCHKCNGSGIVFVGGIRGPVDKPFHCNVCDGTFSRYSSLWSHKRLHTGDKPFKCEICGLTFARQAYLKNHGRVHSGEKPYKCAICGMQFSQSPHLKNHERIHSGERPYQCEICEKTFARHSTLWNHRRIHTGEKPYRCGICGSAFNQATHLKNHSKVHTGEKPHHCDICEVGFSDKFALKRHRLIHEKYARTANNTNPSTPPQSTPTHSASQLEDWKCEVSNNIAFPGCSRPPDK